MPTLTFKPVNADSDISDRELLARVVKETFLEAFGANYSEKDINHYKETRLTMAAVQKELDDPDSYFVLVLFDDKPAGYVKWIVPCKRYLDTPDILIPKSKKPLFFLERFYFYATYFGTGVAQTTMQHVISEAKFTHGSDYLYLTVWEENIRAQRFYQQWGLRVFGVTEYPVGDKVDREYLYGCFI